MLRGLYEWEHWEGVMHFILLVLFVYTTYVLLMDRNNLTSTNLLLATIAVGIGTMVHQNINMRNNRRTRYL